MALRMRHGLMAAAVIAAACGGSVNRAGVSGTGAAGAGGAQPDGSGGVGGAPHPEAGDACVAWVYETPGCGAHAPAPVCFSGGGGACAQQFCTCKGDTVWGGCGFSYEPFSAVGTCEGGVGGFDAGNDGTAGATSCSTSAQCAASSFCDHLFDYCGTNPGIPIAGTCTPRPQSCGASQLPTCGCDGHVYDNPCDAAKAGVDRNAAGGCAVPAGEIACGWTFCDPKTTFCYAIYNDTGPSDFECKPLPSSCQSGLDCSCFPAGSYCSNCKVVSGNGVQGFQQSCGLGPGS